MTALVTLLNAVQMDARADIDAFLAALKQESANDRLEELSVLYHFKTFWDADMFGGNRVMLAQDLAQLMYGTRNVTSLGELLRRYGLDFYVIGGSKDYTYNLLKTTFNISRYAPQASFATYQHFLMAGMKGESDLARKVCAYLLATEEDSRVKDTLQAQAQRPASEILREGWLEHDRRLDGHDKRFEIVEQEARQAKVIAITTQHTVLRLKKVMLEDNEARLKRAQSYLPGELQARMRGRLFEFANWHCLRCHHEVTLEDNLPTSLEIDEVFDRAHGGNRTWNNIQALCKTCNMLKRDAAQRGEFMGRWDFRSAPFRAACEREQQKYDRRMQRREKTLPLFAEET